MIALSPAAPGELEEVWALCREALCPYPDEAAVLRQGLAAGEGVWIHHGGERVGFVQLRYAADRLEVWQLVIAPAWRGRGLGTQVLRRLMADRPVELAVAPENRARRLYRRLGFRGDERMTWVPLPPPR